MCVLFVIPTNNVSNWSNWNDAKKRAVLCRSFSFCFILTFASVKSTVIVCIFIYVVLIMTKYGTAREKNEIFISGPKIGNFCFPKKKKTEHLWEIKFIILSPGSFSESSKRTTVCNET